MMTQIPMSSPDITAAEIEAVNLVIESRCLSIGPLIVEFEDRFAAYIETRHAAGVSSGTAGLHLCIIAAGIGECDLVVTTPFSFIASANCILYKWAIPILVDIDPQTLNIDPTLLAQAADDLVCGGDAARRWLPPAIRDSQSEIGNVKAILPVDAFGQPADYDPICQVADRYDWVIIEDACEAVGAEYKGRKVGTLGHMAVFTLSPDKQMIAGEGGMIVTGREDWDALFRSLRNQGRDAFDAWPNRSRLGYSYRLDEMSAALGLAQLDRIEELLAKRERVAGWYNERLKDTEGVQIPYIAPTTTRMSWFVYVIRLAPEINRNGVMAALKERGIPSQPYHTSIHLQPFYQERFGYRKGDFPVTEAVARSVLALPFSGVMTEKQVADVCEHLAHIVNLQ